jgi:hypothetical protein
MTHRPIAPALLACAALAAAGCLGAQVKASSLCATEGGQIVPGVSPGGSIHTQVTIDLGDLGSDLNQSGVTGTVLLHQFAITSEDPLADLYGVAQVGLVATTTSPGSTLPPVVLTCDYQRPAGATPPLRTVTASCSGPNLFDYVKAKSLTLDIDLAGTGLPSAPWTASMGACMSVQVDVDYTAL